MTYRRRRPYELRFGRRVGNRAMLLGVCARLGGMLGLPAWPVRLLAVVFLVFHTMTTIALYLLAAVLMARGAVGRELR